MEAAKIKESSFLSYELTPEQRLAGATFNLEQRLLIQNLIAEAAEEKIALTFDPTHPHVFQQREAALAGQIGILKSLLDMQQLLTEGN